LEKNWRGGRNPELLCFAGFLYGSRASLVTTSGKERATASEEEEHASVLASMRVERMRTSSSF
jgi:hypothetical protein